MTTQQDLLRQSGIPDDYDPNAPQQPASQQPTTIYVSPSGNTDDPRKKLLQDSGIPDNFTPSQPAPATGGGLLSDIPAFAAGAYSGLKSTIDVPAEKLASLFGQGASVTAADQQVRQNFLNQYGTDPYATAGDVSGKIAGVFTAGRAARVLAAPAEALAAGNKLVQMVPQAIPYVAKGANALGSALEGYVGSAVTGGDRLMGALGGFAAPGIQYLSQAGKLTKPLEAAAAATAGALGWTHGLSTVENLLAAGGAGAATHYLAAPAEWFVRQLTKSPAVTGALAGNTLPDPFITPSDPVTAGAQATP